MRHVRHILLVFTLAACSGGGHPAATHTGPGSGSAPAGYSRDAYHCTPASGANADADIAACNAKPEHCTYGQALTCRGTPPPPDVEAAEDKARAEGTVPCACVCPADQRACSEVP